MRSMTGYGQAQAASERFRVAVVARGVNHRFLDLALRLREEQRASEAPLRDLVAAAVGRGRVEMTVEVQSLAGQDAEVEINRPAISALHRAGQELLESGLVSAGPTFGDLLRVPELVRVRGAASAWQTEDADLLLALARQALAQFNAARELEGAKLREVLAERVRGLRSIHGHLAMRRVEVSARLLADLRARMQDLLGDHPLDEGRLAQEAALLADRSDVAEELDRLRLHLEHFEELLDAEGGIGKRMDFLAQEIFRELNTLGSKCRDSEMTRSLLDAKVLCEQLREQVQNLE